MSTTVNNETEYEKMWENLVLGHRKSQPAKYDTFFLQNPNNRLRKNSNQQVYRAGVVVPVVAGEMLSGAVRASFDLKLRKPDKGAVGSSNES
ncbi:unnamed protein product [Nesidiocoris tenuis]|uniref:Uncharacterized protein n=1 Tax=Nesidiocoris tenuis TaxID=355587 RepID=A0A6H5GFT1_9HEMI|nr:unnamed protein product [Nesidiocoris tenuis]